MATRLLTIPGIYDGKTIQPLETIATDKKQHVLITFLDELAPSEKSEPNGNGKLYHLSAELNEELRPLAHAAGVDDVESFVVAVMKEKLQLEKNKSRFYEITDQIREGLNQAGLTEEDVLEDFNRIRRTLPSA